jgi:hypothetical protein
LCLLAVSMSSLPSQPIVVSLQLPTPLCKIGGWVWCLVAFPHQPIVVELGKIRVYLVDNDGVLLTECFLLLQRDSVEDPVAFSDPLQIFAIRLGISFINRFADSFPLRSRPLDANMS